MTMALPVTMVLIAGCSHSNNAAGCFHAELFAQHNEGCADV